MGEWILRSLSGSQVATPPRCPKCGEGEVRIHSQMPAGFATFPPHSPVAAWARCTRTTACGWWRVLDPSAPEADRPIKEPAH